MAAANKIALVAALQREVSPLLKHCRRVTREHAGRSFTFFDHDAFVVVCGGMGETAARCATEAVIALFAPTLVMSAGFAGAAKHSIKVGEVFSVRRVVDARDGSRVETGVGDAVLVSFASVAGPSQKAKLARAFDADLIDMEAATVARVAAMHGIAFGALKAVSDELSFEMPPTAAFIASDGQFLTARFVLFAALRPWLWRRIFELSRNTKKAAGALCCEFERYVHRKQNLQNEAREAHLTGK
ncbi:MAG: hypothetical protein JOY93_02990 [Acidobacteriales bacterium]|nr:hypothetical protein [Terriglobales bacterium]